MKLKTDQELFWKKNFGDDYTKRNLKSSNRVPIIGKNLLSNNITIQKALELGANVGYNLDAIKRIYPNSKTFGVEINETAYKIGKKKHTYFNSSILDFKIKKNFDLVFCCGVLIHQNPKYLKKFYSQIYSLSNKYIYISEYFNPTPVMIDYKGNKDKLFKRDFAKELWKMFPNLSIIDYGFNWKEDPLKECDNSNWFLFKKSKK